MQVWKGIGFVIQLLDNLLSVDTIDTDLGKLLCQSVVDLSAQGPEIDHRLWARFLDSRRQSPKDRPITNGSLCCHSVSWLKWRQ